MLCRFGKGQLETVKYQAFHVILMTQRIEIFQDRDSVGAGHTLLDRATQAWGLAHSEAVDGAIRSDYSNYSTPLERTCHATHTPNPIWPSMPHPNTNGHQLQK